MGRGAPWGAVVLAVVGLLAVGRFVDLSPQVEEGFFFAEDDPQLEASRSVAAQYGSSPQIIVRAEDRAGDPSAYEDRPTLYFFIPHHSRFMPDSASSIFDNTLF